MMNRWHFAWLCYFSMRQTGAGLHKIGTWSSSLIFVKSNPLRDRLPTLYKMYVLLCRQKRQVFHCRLRNNNCSKNVSFFFVAELQLFIQQLRFSALCLQSQNGCGGNERELHANFAFYLVLSTLKYTSYESSLLKMVTNHKAFSHALPIVTKLTVSIYRLITIR